MSVQQEYREAQTGPWCDIQGHMPFMRRAAAMRDQPVIIEMGVRSGMSTRSFLAGAEQSRGQVWSCDIAPPQVPAIIKASTRWHFIQADDLSREAQEFLPAECDVLFLDAHADHWGPEEVRQQVLAELALYVPRVRPGGVVLLHDTQWEPPATDLGEPVGAVARALDEFCADGARSWVNRPGWYGLGVMAL